MTEPATAGDGRQQPPRCSWCLSSELMIAYHDTEWGVPTHDDAKLFEFLVLDAFQAGLSWAIILKKREGFREAFDGFDAQRVARFTGRHIQRLLWNPAIVRNRQKIVATIENARAFLRVGDHHGSFDAFIWQFVGGRTKQNRWRTPKRIPARTKQSDAMSAALKDRGFAFVGSTICYAFMQAAGLVNDHVTRCFRHGELQIGD